MKGYHVTDGNEYLHIAAESRARATGAFIARFAPGIDWRSLRTRREPEWDGDEAWACGSDEFGTETYWGASVRLL